jgi:NAD(P)-dependent dehydrogenase (short-subunit alcohol dehydrogenase family)
MAVAELKSALIIGASRGLGLGLANELCGRGWQVTATLRKLPADADRKAFHAGVELALLDINDHEMVAQFLPHIAGKVFDVVFINAGLGGPRGKTAETATVEEITELFMTNAVSPISLAYKLLPHVKTKTGILAFMTSILGSVSIGAGNYAPLYSASKSALNQLTRSFAGEVSGGVTVLSMHPGWVKTDMGGPGADIDVATSVHGLADVLVAKAGSGKHEYLDYTGATIPW